MSRFHFALYSLLFSLAIACQGAQKSAEVLDAPVQNLSSKSSGLENSEGVVGPDEAFFAEIYLENAFRFSRENPNPEFAEPAALINPTKTAGAFDFTANFTEQRLGLMTGAIFRQGDGDQDKLLSESEFASLKIEPQVFGVSGESFSHGFSHQLFVRFAGEDNHLNADEAHRLLRELGPAVRLALDRSTPQEQRLKLIKAWEKILAQYDADHSGSLSLQEQRDLRQDRALLVIQLSE